MILKEYKESEISKLKEILFEKQKELAYKKALFNVKKEKNVNLYKILKKEIARIQTVIRQKEQIN